MKRAVVAIGVAVVVFVAWAASGTNDAGTVHTADDAYAVSRDACANLVKQQPLSVAAVGVDELVREWMTSWNKDERFPDAAETGCRAGASQALARP